MSWLTHRDSHLWNLFARNGRPVVLDWELGPLSSSAAAPIIRYSSLRTLKIRL